MKKQLFLAILFMSLHQQTYTYHGYHGGYHGAYHRGGWYHPYGYRADGGEIAAATMFGLGSVGMAAAMSNAQNNNPEYQALQLENKEHAMQLKQEAAEHKAEMKEREEERKEEERERKAEARTKKRKRSDYEEKNDEKVDQRSAKKRRIAELKRQLALERQADSQEDSAE